MRLLFLPLILGVLLFEAIADAETIQMIATVLVGLLGIPLVNIIKRRLKLVDQEALLLTGVAAMVLSTITVIVAHALTGDMITLKEFVSSLGIVLSTAMFIYGMFKKESDPPNVG